MRWCQMLGADFRIAWWHKSKREDWQCWGFFNAITDNGFMGEKFGEAKNRYGFFTYTATIYVANKKRMKARFNEFERIR